MHSRSLQQADQSMEVWLKNIKRLPPVPVVIQQAIALLDNKTSRYGDIGKVLSQDEAITAKILQVVNSAFYGLPERVGTVSHAIGLLGFEQVCVLLLSLAVFQSKKITDPLATTNREVVWHHSLSCATWAQAIAAKVRYQPSEQAFVGGLLHDVGKIVMAISTPEEFASAAELGQREGIGSCQAEKDVIGVDHVKIGMLVSEHWKFPDIIHDCIALHHDEWPPVLEDGSPYMSKLRQLLAIVRVANSGSRLYAAEVSPADEAGRESHGSLPMEAISALAEEVNELLSQAVSPAGKEPGSRHDRVDSPETQLRGRYDQARQHGGTHGL